MAQASKEKESAQPSRASQGSLDTPVTPTQASQGQPTQVLESALSGLPALPVMPPLGGLSGLSGQPWGGEKGWEREDHSLAKFSWENVKVLKGKNRKRAVLYLAGRDGVRCTERCRLIVSDPLVLNVHHIDGNPGNNKRWSLRLVDQVCNSRLNGNLRANQVRARLSSLVHPAEREGEYSSTASVGVEVGVAARWSNREGEKHDRERALWDAWVMDQLPSVGGLPRVRGPFVKSKILGLMQLAYMAPRALGLGSWKTYLGYIHEDHYGGPLEIKQIGGRKYVTLREDWIEKHGGILPKMEEDDN